MTRLFLAPLITFALTLSAALAAPVADENPIGRFHQVDGGVFRGQRPEEEGVRYLARHGFKTIVNLDNDDDAVEAEAQVAAAVGVKHLSHPMSGFWAPSDETVNGVLALLKDASNYPLFVHCQHGQDRTGLIVGLYRVEAQGWAPKKAHDEMLELGFHTELFPLHHYFEERARFED